MNPTALENKDITMTIYNFGKTDYFTTNQISGSIAHACLVDLGSNNFTFNGIPRIKTARDPSEEVYRNNEDFGSRDTFTVTLSIENTASLIRLSYSEALKHAVRFRDKEDTDRGLLKLVQNALAELESNTIRLES